MRERDLLSFRLSLSLDWLYYDDKGNADPFIRLSNAPRFPRNRVSREKKTLPTQAARTISLSPPPSSTSQFSSRVYFSGRAPALLLVSLAHSMAALTLYICASFEKEKRNKNIWFGLCREKKFLISCSRGSTKLLLVPRNGRHLFVEFFLFYLVFNSTIIGQEREREREEWGWEAGGQCYRKPKGKQPDRRTDGRTVKS